MAGHSKWSKIKHKKAIKDAKKGKIFSMYAQKIAVAARDGGGDPDMNFSLRLLLQKAKSEGMPQNNIDRAIARGTGQGGDGVVIEEVTYEAFGPHNVGMVIETVTDNRNRTVASLRKSLTDWGGQLADNGAVTWNFSRKGKIVVRTAKVKKSEKFGQADTFEEFDADDVMLELMDIAGIEDINKVVTEVPAPDGKGSVEVEALEITTGAADLGKVRDAIADTGYVLVEAELVYIPNTPKDDLSEEQMSAVVDFVDKVEEMEDVKSVFTELA